MAYQMGAGHWRIKEKYGGLSDETMRIYCHYDFSLDGYAMYYRVTLKRTYVVILRRSRPVHLYHHSSYQRLMEVMGV